MADVLKLVPPVVGDAYAFDIRKMLLAVAEAGLSQAIVVGLDQNGELEVFSSEGQAETVLALVRAQHFVATEMTGRVGDG